MCTNVYIAFLHRNSHIVAVKYLFFHQYCGRHHIFLVSMKYIFHSVVHFYIAWMKQHNMKGWYMILKM